MNTTMKPVTTRLLRLFDPAVLLSGRSRSTDDRGREPERRLAPGWTARWRAPESDDHLRNARPGRDGCRTQRRYRDLSERSDRQIECRDVPTCPSASTSATNRMSRCAERVPTRRSIVFGSNAAVNCHGVDGNVCVDSLDTNWPGGPSNVANWTAGYAKGTTVITLSNTINLAVGHPLILDQLDDATDGGDIYICETVAGRCNDDGPNGETRADSEPTALSSRLSP